MPELPEVETIRIGLEKYLVGHKIQDIEIRVPKIFQGDKKDVIGAKFTSIKRVGKGLILELDNNFILAIHLKLTGQVIYQDEKLKDLFLSPKTGGQLPSKYTAVIFKMDKGGFLYYNDLRRFGWIKAVKKENLKDLSFFKEMGPEPFIRQSADSEQALVCGLKQAKLTLDQFKKIVNTSRSPIKIILMDQKKIGGIGNIYANESLFEARIDPRRKANSLDNKETEKLYETICSVLEKGLKYGGASDVNFVNALGQDGEFQKHFKVYGRKGEKCFECNGVVERISLGGRGTFFCPDCQNRK